MKKNEIQLLLVVLGILMAVASWQIVYKNNQAKAEEIKAENVELQKTVDRLENLNAQKEEYLASIEQMQTEGNKIIDSFASGVRTEDQVMYLYNMELVDANDVRVPSVSMTAAQVVPYSGVTSTEEGYELQDDGIGMFRMESTVTMTTTNNGLKNVLNYIYGIDSRKSISTVSLVASEDGYLSGNMQLNFFYLTGTETPYVETDISGVSTGTSNIFGVLNGSAVQSGNSAQGEETEAGDADEEGDD